MTGEPIDLTDGGARARRARPTLTWLSCTSDDVGEGDDWLTPAERAVQAGLTVPKRRWDWRLGRWTAKQAVARWWAAHGDDDDHDGGAGIGGPAAIVPPADIEVLAGAGGAPGATVRGHPGPALSITHRDGRAVVVVARRGTAVGCDLERAEPRSRAFVLDWFTGSEVAAVDAAHPPERDVVIARTWAAKEAALKAIGEGLRLDTREVEVVTDVLDLTDDAHRAGPAPVPAPVPVWAERPGGRGSAGPDRSRVFRHGGAPALPGEPGEPTVDLTAVPDPGIGLDLSGPPLAPGRVPPLPSDAAPAAPASRPGAAAGAVRTAPAAPGAAEQEAGFEHHRGPATAGAGWRPIEVVWARAGRRFAGWWRVDGPEVLVVVSDHASGPRPAYG